MKTKPQTPNPSNLADFNARLRNFLGPLGRYSIPHGQQVVERNGRMMFEDIPPLNERYHQPKKEESGPAPTQPTSWVECIGI